MPNVHLSFYSGTLSEGKVSQLREEITRCVEKSFNVSRDVVSITLDPVDKEEWSRLVLYKYVESGVYEVLKTPSY